MITVSIAPTIKPRLYAYQKEFLHSIAKSFGIPYEDMAADYRSMDTRERQVEKAERMIYRAGYRGGLGARGMKRKLKRACRLMRKYRGDHISHANMLMRYNWAFHKGMSEKITGEFYARCEEEGALPSRLYRPGILRAVGVVTQRPLVGLHLPD